uniref:DUF6082 family protein n=1 Tax=Paractinoplanes polyasparticus TaxID=2856853 RepID=UPI001C84A27D|nr:DUF6082 family protein [Actinoplanes polyasparticus]
MDDFVRHNQQPVPASQWARWALAVALIGGVVVPAGIGLAAAVSRSGDEATWARWGSVGESFGAINALLSAFALTALIISYLSQSRDLRIQRDDTALQRAVLENAEKALRRSADVDMRNLHMSLMRMAIDDPVLAEVLPSYGRTDEKARRQYLFSNLLLQCIWLQYTAGTASREEMVSGMRHLFTSNKMREYWRETASIRYKIYVDGAQESSLATIADAIWHEHEGQPRFSTIKTGEPGDLAP